MKQRVFYEEFHSFYYYNGTTPNWEMKGFHFHKEYEMILFLCDGATISIGERVYSAGRGDLFLINNREYHKTAGAGDGEYRRFVLMFDPEPVKEAGRMLGYPFDQYFENRSGSFSHKLHLPERGLEEVIAALKKIGEGCKSDHLAEDEVKRKLGILELLVLINGMYGFFEAEETKGETEVWSEELVIHERERIEQIKAYILGHLEEHLDLEELSRRFFMNRYYMSHYFKKETGFTLSQYITNLKMTRAKELLKQGFSVTETAVALSYNSDSYFINTFKKMTGITPKRYAAEKEG